MPKFPVTDKKQRELEARMEQLGVSETDLEEQFIRGGGKGGQKQNKTSNCVQLTHIPSGEVVHCQKERSRDMNRFFARRYLLDRLEKSGSPDGLTSKQAAQRDKIRRNKSRSKRRNKKRTLIDPLAIIEHFYRDAPQAKDVLLVHSQLVMDKAVAIAEKLIERGNATPDIAFIKEASLLHDIGIIKVNAPSLNCHGEGHYLCHGTLGHDMLLDFNAATLGKHALVCERHTGVGLSATTIKKQNLPLPAYDMLPLSLEEKIICYADNFFSKNPAELTLEKSLDDIRQSLSIFGEENVTQFNLWLDEFGP